MPHPSLLDALVLGTDSGREEAEMALAAVLDAGDARRLAKLAREARSSGVRQAAVRSLGRGRAGTRGLQGVLLDALRDTCESPLVRARAAEALGAFPTRGFLAGEALVEALGHPDPELRVAAARTLARLRFRAALGPLATLAAEDRRCCPGAGRVCDEARRSMRRIRSAHD